MHPSALHLLAVSHLGFPMDQSIARDLRKGCLEVEALLLCPLQELVTWILARI